MAGKRSSGAKDLRKQSPAEKLDSLNARLRNRSNSPETIRRSVEAQIEAKTRKRRKQETPASSGWKRP